MIRFTIFSIIKKILIEKLNLNAEDIKMDSRLRMDLNIESWGRTLLFMQMEKDYDITFTFNQITSVKTVNDIISVVYFKINRK